jgi:hypothetical protein
MLAYAEGSAPAPITGQIQLPEANSEPDKLRGVVTAFGRPGGDVVVRPPGLAGQESLLSRLSRQIRSPRIQELAVRQVSYAPSSEDSVERKQLRAS